MRRNELPLSAMCGRLRVGKEKLHVAGLIGAAVAARRKQFERAALLDICAALDHEAILMTTYGIAS